MWVGWGAGGMLGLCVDIALQGDGKFLSDASSPPPSPPLIIVECAVHIVSLPEPENGLGPYGAEHHLGGLVILF